jgi:hypothetical protein
MRKLLPLKEHHLSKGEFEGQKSGYAIPRCIKENPALRKGKLRLHLRLFP